MGSNLSGHPQDMVDSSYIFQEEDEDGKKVDKEKVKDKFGPTNKSRLYTDTDGTLKSGFPNKNGDYQ